MPIARVVAGDGKVPSLKGTVLAGLIEEVRSLLDQSRLAVEQIELRLDAAELEIFEQKVQPVLFYPLTVFHKLTELVCEVEFDGTLDGHRALGARGAEALRSLGVYKDYYPSPEEARRDALRRISLGNVIYNFSRWDSEFDERTGSARTIVTDAAPFASWYPARIEGFILEMQRPVLPTGVELEVTSERPTRDRIIWTTTRR